jgi:SulP family sulfate permease
MSQAERFPAIGFTPKLVTVLREGYGFSAFKADALAGLTVAIVALPLSMAIAIASGASPERGLYTAIIGGFIISALGGSRFQIGGPAAAFVVLLSSITARHGFEGLLLATFLAGAMLFIAGFLKLGTYIKYVPHPVTVGFTAGIAVLIGASQIKELLGLTLSGPEPAAIVPKLEALWAAAATVNPATAGLAFASVALILALRKWRPHWPAFLIAVAVASIVVWLFGFDTMTIASRFGGIPHSPPLPQLPPFDGATVLAILPDAFAIALLGGIESLLSAVVGDSLSGRRHRPNAELVAQGFANMACALFGGITATGTIARTATNVRAGAHGPISGMLHSAILLAVMLIAAPLAGYIPLAVLGAILVVVAWNMVERAEFKALIGASWGDAAVLIVTLVLTVFRDLTEGILVGVLLGSLLFMHRMAEAIDVQSGWHDDGDADEPEIETVKGVIVHRIVGALFFGASGTVSQVLERINEPPRAHIIDLTHVSFADSTAAHLLRTFIRRAKAKGAAVYLAGASTGLRDALAKYGLQESDAPHLPTVDACLAALDGAR